MITKQIWSRCIMPSYIQTNQNKLANIFQLRHFRIFHFSNFGIMLFKYEWRRNASDMFKYDIQIKCYILKQFVNAKSVVYVKVNTQKSNLLLLLF